MEVLCRLAVFLCLVGFTYGGGCDAYTGSGNAPDTLGGNEQTLTDTGLAVRLSGYQTSCSCGIVTRWAFYTRRNGTVVFYVLDGTTVMGKTSISIPVLSHDNYYEIPLSSEMWISVRNGYTLGFFTAELPMITYGTTSYNYYSTTGQSEVNVGSAGSFGSATSGREYAVRAYIETGHAPMFTNLPYTVSIYTHNVGLVLMTVSATDLDPDDVPNLSYSMTSSATFSLTGQLLTYQTAHPASGTVTVTISVTDGCQSTTETVTVELINEPPTFTNLPNTYVLAEKGTGSSDIFTIGTSDLLPEDTVTCVLVSPDAAFTLNSATVRVTYPTSNGGFVHDTRPAYDLLIRCDDADNSIYSVLNIDIRKNQPPVFTPGSGFLPASTTVGRDTSPLYTITATDTEGDSISFSISDCSQTNCPITVNSATGVVTSTTALLPEGNFDVTIETTDPYTVVTKVLTILVSENTDFTDAPSFQNLPDTIYVSENTPANTGVFRLFYREINTWETFTLSKQAVSDAIADTYFQFDTSTGVVSVKAPFDYDTVSPKTVTITYRIEDEDASMADGVLTIVFVNVNEVPSLTIGATTITVDEGVVGSIFSDPGLVVTDADSGDEANAEWSLDCGIDSKYFYINDADKRIYLAREYDMDTGATGNATCVVSVIDPQGLSATGTVTLSINNINDNTPMFPYHRYLFLQTPDDAFFTRVENLTATDRDSNNFGSALGTISYAFDTGNYPQSSTYFQVDVDGILYVRDVSSFSRGDSYLFKMFAVDSGGVTGTTTISILFAEVETATTTTTERNYTFGDDFANYIWLLIVCILIAVTLVGIALMVWFDPVFHDWLAFRLMRIDEWCRHRPKEPKRTVGKLTLTVNKKTLENDPDNAMPWELMAKDANVPEMNLVQEEITARKEKTEKDYMRLTGRNVFEKGIGVRPVKAEVAVHSSASGNDSRDGSPKYDFFQHHDGQTGSNADWEDDADNQEDSDGVEYEGGPTQWDVPGHPIPVVTVTPAPESDQITNDQWAAGTPTPESDQNTDDQWVNRSMDF